MAWPMSLERWTRERPRPDWLRDHPRAPWVAVGAVCLGAFMGQLDASIVTLTYPALQTEFAAGFGAVTWVSLSYLAVLAVLLVPVGRWADARGRKLLYLYGFVLFTVASVGCAVAPSLGWLIAARSIQAVGAALLQANSVALVVLSVRPDRVRTALGLQGAAQAVGLALGPTLGGLLVGTWGWRSVFWVNLPVGLVAVVAGHFFLPRSRHLHPREGRDAAGFALLAAAIVAGLLLLSTLSGLAVAGWTIPALAFGAVAACILLWRVESRARTPLLDVAILRSPAMGRSLFAAMSAYLLLFAPLVLFPPVFTRWGLRPVVGGLLLSCLPLGFAAAAVGANLLRARGSNAVRVAVGGLGSALSLLVLIPVWTSPRAVAVLLFALGACLGVAIPANNASIMAAAPPEAAALTGGLVNVARALGTSLGVAVTALGVHLATTHGLPGPPLVCAILAGCAAIVVASAVGAPPDSRKAGLPT